MPVIRTLRAFRTSERMLWDNIVGVGAISLFDVTLRDGLQGRPKLPYHEKKALFQRILNKGRSMSIEVGSLVSPRVVPQMEDSLRLYRFANELVETRRSVRSQYPSGRSCLPDLFMLVPPSEFYFNEARKERISNISVPASLSEAFQQKNVRKTLEETYQIVSESLTRREFRKMKIYLSCFNECPVSGDKIATPVVVDEIRRYVHLQGVSEVCLSDTIGTLGPIRFYDVLETIAASDIPVHKLSLHLHARNSNVSRHIAMLAMQAGICRFDISHVDSGGCSVTLHKGDMCPNMSFSDIRQSADAMSMKILQPRLEYAA